MLREMYSAPVWVKERERACSPFKFFSGGYSHLVPWDCRR